MTPIRQRQVTPRWLLGAALLGIVLYLSGLSATLQLSDANLPGILLVPALPMPLYIVMAVVVLGGVGVTLLASLRQRRPFSRFRLQGDVEPQGSKNANDHEGTVRLHPASPALSVVVQATEPFGSTPPSEPIW